MGDYQKPETFLRSLWRRVTRTDSCWIWTGATRPNGYGHLMKERKDVLAHRTVYEMLVGPIPEGLTLDHLCRDRACVNPDHLEPVTNKVNILRGFGPAAINARKTHCPQGHEYAAGNVTTWKGHRECRACAREEQRVRRQAKGLVNA